MKEKTEKVYHVGIDIGSTTVKIVLIDPTTKEIIYSDYRRHNADIPGTLISMLTATMISYPDAYFITAVCGSGGLFISQKLGAFFIQEVVANSLVIKNYYKDVRVSIELGGQDAKVVFFTLDEETDQLIASDMRMNGSCAGGTGAFIDQVAELLSIRIEEFGKLADKGVKVYDISGRCGVFAKTDIQPLLNNGVSKEDIALSTFHAIAKQTIGGLAQGMEITPKVIFEGGPLTFNKRLIAVFKERLGLKDCEVIVPEKPEILVAYGAALSIDIMFSSEIYSHENKGLRAIELIKIIKSRAATKHLPSEDEPMPLFFNSEKEKEDFCKRHKKEQPHAYNIPEGCKELDVYIGIDAGSTTSKIVLIDNESRMVDSFYSSNHGDPFKVVKYALKRLYEKYRDMGINLNVLGLGTTGYGEMLFSKAFFADYHTVETVAHAEAAQFFVPDVSFILDIGGQDMKAINLRKGIVTGIVLNEACSAGCGSFVETYAKSLGISVDKIADLAFRSKHPSLLGSRCTVFMNSSIITEQKNGKRTEDILAGISRSIIENVFTKVVRVSNFNDLGEKIVVQGGTFKNEAVLRAFEQYTNREVIKAPYPGEMGAFGIALLVKKHMEEIGELQGNRVASKFQSFEAINELDYDKKPSVICNFCTNYCNRTIISFSNGNNHITGNRCERGEIIGSEDQQDIKQKLKDTTEKLESVPDMMKLHNQLLVENYPVKKVYDSKIKIGIPRTLEFWYSLPFWQTFFTALGFEVVLSSPSSYDIFERGLQYVPSDTACFPAKLVHGHIEDLVAKGVDRIFLPMMIRMPKENDSADGNHTCVMLQGYSMVVEQSNDVTLRTGIKLDMPIFHWFNEKLKSRQITSWLSKEFSIKGKVISDAIKQGNNSLEIFRTKLKEEGAKIIESIKGSDKIAVVLAGRPYHADLLINHDLSTYFTSQDIPVLTIDSLPDLEKQNLSDVRMETTINFHSRMIGAAIAVSKHPNLEIVQIVSFGCGHDAIISDEMLRELKERCDKELLILKLDEGESVGPLNIRIKSFIETIKSRRKKGDAVCEYASATKRPKKILYTKKDRKEKIILVPNLSPAFSYIISRIMCNDGIRMEALPVADKRAIELGKKYVHNDICYPAQINIGEALAYLENTDKDKSMFAIGLAKNCESCRAGQYATLGRKALDEAGYPNMPIITTGIDTKGIHPGFKFTIMHQLKMLWGLTIIDTFEMMLRRIRPYEKMKGLTDNTFNHYVKVLSENISKRKDTLLKILVDAINAFNDIETTDEKRKPRVGIVGEILLNYHPASNCYIESYLEMNGMEIVQPAMHDFFRKEEVVNKELGRRKLAPFAFIKYFIHDITGKAYDYVHGKVWGIVDKYFRFAEHRGNIHNIVEKIRPFVDISYSGAEGWKLPGEILEMYEAGVKSFVIIQPFGCIPNHIVGRGMIKMLKKQCPNSQIIALDYDPDTSIGNVENRLQMLIINARELEGRDKTAS
ncbi:MAG: acyl-CoA dehydratase activase [Spirochaetaceae bacterium]|nr:acyl-CoA dehydratase activase [Spirochaetaceae bacterium]